MSKIKITKTTISKILDRKVSGWNDKRMNFNRIKLTQRLSDSERLYLENDLRCRFPEYNVNVIDVRWNYYRIATKVVTAIYIEPNHA